MGSPLLLIAFMLAAAVVAVADLWVGGEVGFVSIQFEKGKIIL